MDFVRYINDPDLHDGRVLRVEREGKTARVFAESYAEEQLVIVFDEVEDVRASDPKGMELYAIAEMVAPAPLRHFVFVNGDQEEIRGGSK